MAVAMNYDIPSFSDLPIRNIVTYSAPTAYDGYEFAFFSPIDNQGLDTFSIYGMSVYVQEPSDTDIIFKLYNNSLQVDTIEFTLPAGSNSATVNDGSVTPLITGLDYDNTYNMRCVQSVTPGSVAQGVEFSYYLHGI